MLVLHILLGLPDILIYISMFCIFVNMYVLFVLKWGPYVRLACFAKYVILFK